MVCSLSTIWQQEGIHFLALGDRGGGLCVLTSPVCGRLHRSMPEDFCIEGGSFISLRQFRKREHRQIFGLRFLDGLPLYIPANPLAFTGLDGVGAHLLYPYVDKCER